MRISVGTKLICTYLAVIGLTAAPAAGICYYLRHVRQSQARVLNVTQPTVAAAKGVREGLHEAAAGLRGYLAIGGEHFRAQRQQGQEHARGGLEQLDSLAHDFPTDERRLLDDLRRELGDIEAIHRAMETAPTAHDVPAFQKLAGDSTPLGERMLAGCHALIEVESKLEKTPQRAKLLAEMTDLRAALHGSLMEMHSYLTTAQERHIQNFASRWQELASGLSALAAKRRLLTPDQARQLGQLQQLVGQFQPLPDRLFAMRKSESWNVAQQKAKNEAGPREARAEALAAELIQRSEARARQAQQALQTQTAWLASVAIGGPGAAAILGILVGFAATQRLARRVRQTTEALEAVAAGDLTARLPAETRDEFGRMALAINMLAETTSAHSTTPQPQIHSELNTERLRTFVGAEVGRRRPFARPHGASGRHQATAASELAPQAAAQPSASASLATSSERLQTQTTQLDQFMRQVQEGLARIAASDSRAAEASDGGHSEIHGPESAVSGPKGSAVRQAVLENA